MGTLINDCDQCFFDSIASELNQLVGVDATIYVFLEDDSEIDPLWGEEITTVYKKNSYDNVGIDCPVFFRSPERTASMGDEGYRLDKRTTIEIAASDMRDRGIRRLRQGDIIYVSSWGSYWDVVESSSTNGQIADTGTVSVYSFDVVRRTQGVPESLWRPGEDG